MARRGVPWRLAVLALLPTLASPPAAAQEPIDIHAEPASRPTLPDAALPPEATPAWRPPQSPSAAEPWRRVPALQPLFSVEVGPSLPFLRGASMLGTGFLVGAHGGFQVRSNGFFSIGPEARLSYSRWANTVGYLGYTPAGDSGLLLATVGLRGIFHVGRLDLWGGARVGYAQLWRGVEPFPRLGSQVGGIAYDLEVGGAVVLQNWVGLGLTLGVAQPWVGHNIGMADFKLAAFSVSATLYFRPRSRLREEVR